MKLLILPGIGCNQSIWNDIDWLDHDIIFLKYDKYMNETTKTVEDIAKEIIKDLSTSTYDGVIAHSMGGFIGAILLDELPLIARFFIAIETSFVPANPSYKTMLYNNNHTLKDKIENMFETEIKKYPKALITYLQGAFDLETTLNRITVPKILIYSNRDITDEKELYDKLNLTKETFDKVQLFFIDKAAHFPMLENPSQTNKIIHSILKTYE